MFLLKPLKELRAEIKSTHSLWCGVLRLSVSACACGLLPFQEILCGQRARERESCVGVEIRFQGVCLLWKKHFSLVLSSSSLFLPDLCCCMCCCEAILPVCCIKPCLFLFSFHSGFGSILNGSVGTNTLSPAELTVWQPCGFGLALSGLNQLLRKLERWKELASSTTFCAPVLS